MKATVIALKNIEEIRYAQKVGIDVPKQEMAELAFYFNLQHVVTAFRLLNGDIMTFIGGREYVLKYEAKVWKRITEHLGT